MREVLGGPGPARWRCLNQPSLPRPARRRARCLRGSGRRGRGRRPSRSSGWRTPATDVRPAGVEELVLLVPAANSVPMTSQASLKSPIRSSAGRRGADVAAEVGPGLLGEEVLDRRRHLDDAAPRDRPQRSRSPRHRSARPSAIVAYIRRAFGRTAPSCAQRSRRAPRWRATPASIIATDAASSPSRSTTSGSLTRAVRLGDPVGEAGDELELRPAPDLRLGVDVHVRRGGEELRRRSARRSGRRRCSPTGRTRRRRRRGSRSRRTGSTADGRTAHRRRLVGAPRVQLQSGGVDRDDAAERVVDVSAAIGWIVDTKSRLENTAAVPIILAPRITNRRRVRRRSRRAGTAPPAGSTASTCRSAG